MEIVWDISALMAARPIFKTVFKTDERDEGTVVLLRWPASITGLAIPTFSGEQMLVTFEIVVDNSGESDEYVPFHPHQVNHQRRFPAMMALYEGFRPRGLSAILKWIDLDFKAFVGESGVMHTFPFCTPLGRYDDGLSGQFTVTFTDIVKY